MKRSIRHVVVALAVAGCMFGTALADGKPAKAPVKAAASATAAPISHKPLPTPPNPCAEPPGFVGPWNNPC